MSAEDEARSRLTPATLLTVGWRHHHGFVVLFGRVLVDRGGGLGAEIAALCVEVHRAYAVGTARARKFHPALDALDSIGFHCLDCSPSAAASLHAMVTWPK